MKSLPNFSTLFKKYRLRSEIETLSEFGDLLAEEGFIYETSLFTRWQNGERVPKDRRIILAIIRVFLKHDSVKSLEEINKLLESLNQRDLSENENIEIQKYLHPQKNITLPEKSDIFVDREELTKDLIWNVISKRHVWLYGLPGVGKTALALHIAHRLREMFNDGILWFRADIKDPQLILDEFLSYLGYDPQGITNMELKLNKLSQLVKDRNILLILDNINLSDLHSVEIKHFLNLPIALLCTSLEINTSDKVYAIKVKYFTLEEFIELSRKILGHPFLEVHRKQIGELGTLLGYLPITSIIVLKQIFLNPLQLENYISQIKKGILDFSDVTYDNKNLYTAFEFSFSKLSQKQRQLLIHCSLFDGTDFSIDALAHLNDISRPKVKLQLEKLIRLSFVETSIKGRYRMHPSIKKLLNKKEKKENYVNFGKFYIENFRHYPIGSNKYIRYLLHEFDNIMALILRLNRLRERTFVTVLWSLISPHIFYSGKWYLLIKYNELMKLAYIRTNNYRGLVKNQVEYIGGVYFFQNKMKQVYKILSESLHLAKKNNDLLMLGLIKQKYGIVFSQIDEFKKAEKYLLDTVQILKKEKMHDELAKTFAYLCLTYGKMGKYKLAVKYGKKAIKGSLFINDEMVKGHTILFLARSYLHLNKHDLAERYFLNADKIMKRYHVKIGQAHVLRGLGQIYQSRGNNQKAIKTLKKSAQFFKELNMKEEEHDIAQLLLRHKSDKGFASTI